MFAGILRGNALERLTLSGSKVVNEEPLLAKEKMRVRTVKVGPDGALCGSGGGSITDDTTATSKLLKLTPK